ncbi:hypothetical protein ACR6C2_43105 [Streptomyces sp. INA 01156]
MGASTCLLHDLLGLPRGLGPHSRSVPGSPLTHGPCLGLRLLQQHERRLQFGGGLC